MSFASLVGGKLQSWKQFVLLLLLIVFLFFFYCFSTHGNVEPLSQSDGDVASAVINENTEEDLNISQIDKTASEKVPMTMVTKKLQLQMEAMVTNKLLEVNQLPNQSIGKSRHWIHPWVK